MDSPPPVTPVNPVGRPRNPLLIDDDEFDNGPEPEMNEDIMPTQDEDTQPNSQVQASVPDKDLWGLLQPCHRNNRPIHLRRTFRIYKVGRNKVGNQIILPSTKISNKHCTITWDGELSSSASVIVQDMSTNGTFVNGDRIGKGKQRLLRQGDEISFGTVVPQPASALDDYRFLFRLLAGGGTQEGMYAEYDLISELGKGSFATVMKALERQTGETRAIKMIHHRVAGNSQDEETRNKQLTREIEIMRGLRHPNICALHKVFREKNGSINLVLDLIDGGDLLDFILQHHGVNEAMGKHISYQICDALSYCHARLIAHRDLKPENILLTKTNPPMVKIADFGLAKVVDSATMLRTMCGTPAYLAPEVVSQVNDSGYGHMVDAWSVGVIMYSMLTNQTPFDERDSCVDIRQKIIERDIVWQPLYDKGISEYGIDLIWSFLFRDPKKRLTMAAALTHPWFSDYRSVTDYSQYDELLPPNQRKEVRDAAGSVMDIDRSRSTFRPEMSASQIEREAALTRRSRVVGQAAEDNMSMPAPPADMVANWSRVAGVGVGAVPQPIPSDVSSATLMPPPPNPVQTPVINAHIPPALVVDEPMHAPAPIVDDERMSTPTPDNLAPRALNGKRSLSPMSDVEENGDVRMNVMSPRKKPRVPSSSDMDTDKNKARGRKPTSSEPRRSSRNKKHSP
ncbi:Pkinase-domain-containing protein [Cylindrobasidium torrendii FP15055 ss-10]|uniref:Pkinase-domain-containing protein n=1 Tax=Cylindrobasidium torrendii FP15055 ss-10 TaxID=1314674 RepID=A0A0D7BE90_9AGAR|nr:Pkinase-domain-containing protein [Cylindrobasidium torrendii FP15055 ss-10]